MQEELLGALLPGEDGDGAGWGEGDGPVAAEDEAVAEDLAQDVGHVGGRVLGVDPGHLLLVAVEVDLRREGTRDWHLLNEN